MHCTGLLGLDAFAEFDIPRESVLGTADGAEFVAADGSVGGRSTPTQCAPSSSIARVFDQSLADASRSAGAELRAGARVRVDHGRTARTSALTFDDQPPVHARVCILACGANYRFNRQLGLGVPRAFVQSAQLERPFDGPERVEVHLGREVAPGGFAWLVPFSRDGKAVQPRRADVRDSRRARASGRSPARMRDRFGVPEGGWPEPRLKILPLGPVSRDLRRRACSPSATPPDSSSRRPAAASTTA